MKNKHISFYLVFTIALLAASCKTTVVTTLMEMPALEEPDAIIHHKHYCLNYSEQHEQAIWVAYQLTSQELEKNVPRSNSFRIDPLINLKSANSADYKKSGYDRGHLAPSRDMCFDSIAQIESFYYSNMSPQLPGFNRGIWSKLESEVRTWAETYDTLYIVTGPVLSDELPTIGENHVSVPEFFYKAVLINTTTTKTAIGFIIPNEAQLGKNIAAFSVCIDSIETVTGLDLFPLLPNDIEIEIESKVNRQIWGIEEN